MTKTSEIQEILQDIILKTDSPYTLAPILDSKNGLSFWYDVDAIYVRNDLVDTRWYEGSNEIAQILDKKYVLSGNNCDDLRDAARSRAKFILIDKILQEEGISDQLDTIGLTKESLNNTNIEVSCIILEDNKATVELKFPDLNIIILLNDPKFQVLASLNLLRDGVYREIETCNFNISGSSDISDMISNISSNIQTWLGFKDKVSAPIYIQYIKKVAQEEMLTQDEKLDQEQEEIVPQDQEQEEIVSQDQEQDQFSGESPAQNPDV